MLRALMTVSGFTLISRVLGVVRDMLIARYLGAGMVSDAFLAAFRFPNLFRRIFGEGAFNSAFVPLFGKRVVEDGRAAAMRFGNNAFSGLFLVLGLLTVVLIPLMGWVMMAVVPGFKAGYEGVAGSGEQEFRVPLTGARAIYLETEGAVLLSGLKVVERGEPEVEQVIQELFGGLTPAEGEEVRLEEAFAKGLQRESETKEGESPEALLAKSYAEGVWRFDEAGQLRVPLPEDHDFAVVQGRWEGVEGSTLRIFRNDPGAYDYAVELAQITFVYLLCMALVANLGGVLNTLKKFAVPAFSPVLLNIVFLVGLLVFVRTSEDPGAVLAWCVAIAGVLQLMLLVWACSRAGLKVELKWPKLTPEMRRLLVLMGPGVLAAGIQQINLLVGGVIASFQQGGITFLYYADRVYQLPLGMIGIAFGVVLLPEISKLLKRGDEEEAAATMVRGVELSMLVTIPATVALVFIPHEICQTLFQWGDFTAMDSEQTARALVGFAFGLPAFVLIKVLQPGYFAREDTKTPMVMAGVTVLVNIVASLILFSVYEHVGIAVATSIAGWVNVILLWGGLRKVVVLPKAVYGKILGMVLAAGVMGGLLWMSKIGLEPWLGALWWQRVISLALLIGTGVSSYFLMALLLKATSVTELKRSFLR